MRLRILMQYAGTASLLAVLLAFSGCETPSSGGFAEQVAANTPVVLGPGDSIRFSFTAAPELNQAQKIRADGKISLPQVGEVTAAGKTLTQFQSELSAIYKSQVRNTDVFLTLDSGVTQVYLSGAVRT